MAKNGKRLGFLPGWRKGTYVILVVNIVMLIWVIAGAAGNANSADCQGINGSAAQAGCQAGTGIGIGLLIVLWVMLDIILGIIWLVTNRKKTRECPACGKDVKKGLFVCATCGYDFRSAIPGQGSVPVTAPPQQV